MEHRDGQRIAEEILRMLRERGSGKSLCPSEVARALVPAGRAGKDEAWRGCLPAVREVAGELASEGLIRVTQGGKSVAVATARGPIRLALVEGNREGEESR